MDYDPDEEEIAFDELDADASKSDLAIEIRRVISLIFDMKLINQVSKLYSCGKIN